MATYNSFTFGTVNSADFGIYIGGEGTFNAPERRGEMITIPGKNGALFLDEGAFENIELTYPAFNYEEDLETFRTKLAGLRNALCSQIGYQRLTDTFHPDEYRLAVFKSGLDVSPIKYNTASEFNIVFDCKPQRFLIDGDRAISPTEWSDLQTESGELVTIESDGSLAVKSLEVSLEPIQSLNGYDKPWVGGAGANLFPYLNARTATFNGVTFSCDGKGTLTMQGTATANDYISLTFPQAFVIPDGADYKFCMLNDEAHTDSVFRFVNGSTIVDSWSPSPANREAPYAGLSGKTVTGIRLYCAQGETYNLTMKPMFVPKSTTVTGYIPYSNICPISGHTEVVTSRCGENVWDEEWEVGNIDPSSGANIYSTAQIRSKNYIQVKPNTTIYLYSAVGGTFNYRFYKADKTYLRGTYYGANQTLAIPEEVYYMRFAMGGSYGTTYNHDISINYPSTDHDYHAYNGTQYTTDLGRTVYGGTLDVVSGVLTVTHAMVDLGSLNWNLSDGIRARTRVIDYTREVASWSGDWHNTKSNVFSCEDPNLAYPARSDYSFANIPQNYYNFDIKMPSGVFADGTAVKNWLADIDGNGTHAYICIELATPQTYQLTPQQIELLVGENHLWSDGEITLTYGVHPYYNPTPFESKPLIKVTGTGTLGIGEYILTITGTASQTLYIDCETMEIYTLEGTVPIGASSLVSINKNDFPVLEPGTNYISVGSGITAVTITPRWWRI